MLHEFLEGNRKELIDRCRAKVARRSAPRPTPGEMEHGVPLFLGQLIETLRIEQRPDSAGHRLSPAGTRESSLISKMAAAATQHGRELLQGGFTVDQVVHDYGDLCQAVTELAVEKKAPISADEFQCLNRCLDNAIADAVTAFGSRRDQQISRTSDHAMSERLGILAHELRILLNTAMLSFAAIKSGAVGVNGVTGSVLDRSHFALRDLIDRALADVRLAAGAPSHLERVAVDQFIAEVQVAASLEARARGCDFTIAPVEPGLAIQVDKPLLSSAVSNLLQNAFKFTRWRSEVSLKAYGLGERVLIEVQDQCGGLPEGKTEAMFRPFERRSADRSGPGLGLSISRRAVEASGGTLSVREVPSVGCVFTVDLPRYADEVGRTAGLATRSQPTETGSRGSAMH